MPYISQGRREYLDGVIVDVLDQLRELDDKVTTQPGDFNYVITQLLLAAWRDKPDYARGNAIIGILECVKQEFYRRVLAPYENQKIKENGDVF